MKKLKATQIQIGQVSQQQNQIYSNFFSTFKFLFRYLCLNWRCWLFIFLILPVITIMFAYFEQIVSYVTLIEINANWARDELARTIQFSALIISVFFIPIMMNILFSSSLNYLFYIHRIKKINIAISLFLISFILLLIATIHGVWVTAVFFNSAFYIQDGIEINIGQTIYSIVVMITLNSTLSIILSFFVTSKIWLLLADLVIVILCLLLGALVIDNYKINVNEPYYYLVLLWPHNYLTSMLEMSVNYSANYYSYTLPQLNGSLFNPLDDMYINILYPYISMFKFPSWYIWLSLIIPWLWICAGWFWIWFQRNNYRNI